MNAPYPDDTVFGLAEDSEHGSLCCRCPRRAGFARHGRQAV